MVKILLGRKEVNPDKPGVPGRTPLLFTTQRELKGIVKILFRPDEVNPNKLDKFGRISLSHTPLYKVKEMLKYHSNGKTSPSKPDNNDRIPLSHAAKNGRVGVIEILLGWEEVNPDKPGNGGQTPPSVLPRNSKHRSGPLSSIALRGWYCRYSLVEW